MRHLMDIEPVVVTNLVAAVLAVAVAFNVPITDDQRNAIMGLVAAIVAIYFGSALVARNRVYSPQTMRRIVSEVEATQQ